MTFTYFGGLKFTLVNHWGICICGSMVVNRWIFRWNSYSTNGILMACYSSKRRVSSHFSFFWETIHWQKREIDCPAVHVWFFQPGGWRVHGLGVTGILLASALQIGRHRGVAGWRSWGLQDKTWGISVTSSVNHMQFWWWFTRKRTSSGLLLGISCLRSIHIEV